MTISKRNRLARHLASEIAHRAGLQAELELTAQRHAGIARARVVAAAEYDAWLAAGGDPADPYRERIFIETATAVHAPWGDGDWRRVYEDAVAGEYDQIVRRRLGVPALRAMLAEAVAAVVSR